MRQYRNARNYFSGIDTGQLPPLPPLNYVDPTESRIAALEGKLTALLEYLNLVVRVSLPRGWEYQVMDRTVPKGGGPGGRG